MKPLQTIQPAQPIQLVQQVQGGTISGNYLSSGSSIPYKETAALRELNAKIKRIPRVRRPSLRRTDEGFMRHTLAAELKLNRKVDHLIEQLDMI